MIIQYLYSPPFILVTIVTANILYLLKFNQWWKAKR